MVSYLLAYFIGLTFWGRAATDPDLGWHLFGGAWIAAHHTLPTFDPINSFNTEWHDYHWLAQTIFFSIFNLGGYELLRCMTGVLMAYLLVVLLDLFYISVGRKKSALFVTVFLVAATLLLAHVTSVRPQLLSVLLVALSARRLNQPSQSWELPYLFLLSILHVNIHVFWVLTPTLYFIYRLVPALLHREKLTPILGFLALSLAGFVSPYGAQNYALIWEYASMPEFLQRSISEFTSVFASSTYVVALVLGYIVLLARLFRRKQALAKPAQTLSAFIAALIVTRGIKFISLFIILGSPYIIRNSGVAIRKYAPSLFDRESWVSKSVLSLVLILSMILTLKEFPSIGSKLDVMHERYPLEACRILALSQEVTPSKYGHVRVLTHFNHGGWCRWALFLNAPNKDFRVTTDGRTQGVPPEQFRKSFELFRLGEGWNNTLIEWDPDAAIVPTDIALAQVLPLIKEWKELYRDKHFVLYQHLRNSAANPLPTN